MKKKSLLVILAMMMAAALSFGFVSCGGDSDDEGGTEEQEVYETGEFDFSAKNSDGVTLYYNVLNADEAEVTYGLYGYETEHIGYENLKNIRIPSTVTNNNRTLKVTRIGEGAFLTNTEFVSISIPNSITSIGRDGLGYVEKIIISDIATWCKIDFEDDPYAGPWNLYSNESIPITNLIIPSGVTSIPNNAFRGCNNLTSVTIPSGVTSIGEHAFEGCNLTSVSLPNTLEKIGMEAFYYCNISEITIPKSVKEIDSQAFDGNPLLSVTSLIEDPDHIRIGGYNAFPDKIFKNGTLYVPAGTLSKYKETWPWKEFLYIEEK